jgi:copper homeostasis protein
MHPKLEVVVLSPADAEAAEAGGADRVQAVGSIECDGLSPEPRLVSALRRSSDLPMRVMVRLSDGFSTTGGELTRLVGLAEEYLSLGAEGLVFGFLDPDLEIDLEITGVMVHAIGGAPWTFHRAIDQALDYRRAWRQVKQLPGLDAVLTAGSASGSSAGIEELLTRAKEDTDVARLALVAGALEAEQIPWLTRAGIHQFQLGSLARPGGSWTRSSVDAGYVRSWRTLVDDAAARPV